MYELEGISAGYEGVKVIQDVTLSIPKGKVIGLLGPNGAGKTTMLRVASRALPLTDGVLTLEGSNVTGTSAHRLARLGVCHVPEGRGIFPSLTTAENIALFAGSRGAARGATDRVVAEFPSLGRLMNRTAGTMSGGEQQMLALSRACVTEPKVVMLDEVSLGLAPRIVDELFVFLRRLAETGVSLLLVEQYIDRALALCDRVYLLQRGQLAYDGPPAELDSERLIHSYVGL
jgi:branched-chain amino acid transport system ATP-binding protein